jgi:hypothetical protein
MTERTMTSIKYDSKKQLKFQIYQYISDFQPVCRGTLVWREGSAVCRGSLGKVEKKREKKRNKKITLQCTFTTPPFALVKPPVSVFSQLLFGSGVLFHVGLH